MDSIDIASVYDPQVPVINSSLLLTGRLTLRGIFGQEFPSALASMLKGTRFLTVDPQFCGEIQEIIDAFAATIQKLICHPSGTRGTCCARVS